MCCCPLYLTQVCPSDHTWGLLMLSWAWALLAWLCVRGTVLLAVPVGTLLPFLSTLLGGGEGSI